MPHTLSELKPTLGSLNPSQLQQLFRLTLGLKEAPAPDAVLSDGVCLVLWLAALLTSRRLLPESQRLVLIDAYVDAIVEAGNDAGSAGGRAAPAVLSMIDGGRLARFSGHDGFLDLQLARRVPAPERPPVEYLSLDLAALFARMTASLHHPGSVPAAGATKNA